ncbi:MAG: glycosyltransferase, partial [Sphingomonas sp.]
LIERALRCGWRDGAAGHEPGEGIAARLDLALPGEQAPALRGNIDILTDDRIEGWAAIGAEAAADHAPPWRAVRGVWIVEDDVPVAECRTGLIRADLMAANCAVDAGFATRVNRNGRRLTGRIDLRCGETGLLVCTAHMARHDGEPGGAEPLPLAGAPAVTAFVDGVSGGAVVGWARCTAQPNRTVFVDVEVNGVRHAGLRADKHRDDLVRPGWDDGRHAFELVLPAALCCAPLHVRVFENGRDRLLVETTTHPPDAGGYTPDFTPADYLRWAYLNDYAPVGLYQRSHALAAWFGMNRTLLADTHPERGARVSVIMPVRDRREIVGTAIASVLAQSYADWELIIVDDASRDGSADEIARIIAVHADPRISLIRLADHAGVSAARNVGLGRAGGELIAYLDSDNMWHRDFLRVMAGILGDEPEAPAAYCGQEIWQRPQGLAEAELRTVRAAPFNRSDLERGNRIDLNIFVHRRSLFTRLGGFRDDLRRFVDWELILRYTRDRPPRFVPAILSRYNLDAATNRISDVEPVAPALACIRRAFSPAPKGMHP